MALYAGQTHAFYFQVTRDDYLDLAPTERDVANGAATRAVPAEESFYALLTTARCVADDGTLFIHEINKILCEPVEATLDFDAVHCAAKRGTFVEPDPSEVETVVFHGTDPFPTVAEQLASQEVDARRTCAQVVSALVPSFGSCEDVSRSLCFDSELVDLECTDALLAEAAEAGLYCAPPRCETTSLRCHCQADWQVVDGDDTLSGRGCANPNSDPLGDWCMIVEGSCRGRGTAVGLPNPQEGHVRGDGFFDYCGTGAAQSLGWSREEEASVEALLVEKREAFAAELADGPLRRVGDGPVVSNLKEKKPLPVRASP